MRSRSISAWLLALVLVAIPATVHAQQKFGRVPLKPLPGSRRITISDPKAMPLRLSKPQADKPAKPQASSSASPSGSRRAGPAKAAKRAGRGGR